MNSLLNDLRYALRTLRNRPAFSAVAILALALGIGANTAIFSVINAVLLRRLPYGDPDRLAMVWLDNRRLGLHEDLMSYPILEDWKKNNVFESMAGFTLSSSTLTGEGEPERVAGAMVPAAWFTVLGVGPRLGRAFTPDQEQPGRDNVALLSHGLWVRRFGADPQVVGKSFQLDGKTVTVAGVMPPDFRFPEKKTELWMPLALDPRTKNARYAFWMSVVGRLKPGVTWDQARAEMQGLGARIERQDPQLAGYGVWVVPLHTQLVGNLRPALLMLFAAVVSVLLIACANVANLLLARAASREREIAVRAALGAGRGRLIRQLLTESAVLGLVAGALGLGLAVWGVDAITRLGPRDMPGLDDIRADSRVLAFTFLISLATGIVFGLLPAFAATRLDLSESLKEGGRAATAGPGGRRLRQALVVAEIAAAVVLVAGAGLLIRSFAKLRAVDPGFRPERLLTMKMVVSQSTHREGPQVAALYQQILDRLAQLPGVESAGMVSDLFLSKTPNSGNFSIEGRPPVPIEQQIEATLDAVSPAYFAAMGVPLLKGRFFDQRDGANSPPVVLINDTMARRFWPGEDPVGKRFTFGSSPGPNPRWLTVAGVVGDMRRQGLDQAARCETFLPHALRPRRGMTLVVRTRSEPAQAIASVRSLIRSIAPDQPLFAMAAMEELLGESVAQRRFHMVLLGVFSALALALAAIGIYGVMHYAVVQRTPEIGIRIALGARPADVLRLVLRQGLNLTLTGLAVGLIAALAFTRLMSTLLFGVAPGDPATFAGVGLLLAAVALAASYVPSRRASRVDPMEALRHE